MDKAQDGFADAEDWSEWIRTDADARAVDQGYVFDLAAAERVRTFFRQFLRHSKGAWAGQPFELLDWQWGDIVAPLFGWRRPDGTRRYRCGYIEVPKKNGKALALETPLPTPGGWTTMGDVQVGDELFDGRGLACQVLATSAIQPDRPCFRVTFSDGTSIIADADHPWMTTDIPFGVTTVRSTAVIAQSLAAGVPNHILPTVATAEPWAIVAVEQVPSVPVRCVQVDSPSSLYLAGPGMVPTHNSCLFSGLSLYLLLADREPGAEIYSAAVDRDQVSIVFTESANMVEASPQLASRLQVSEAHQ